MSAPGTIEISLETYETLMLAKRKLECLEAHGVDNWEWYGDAMDEFYQEAEREVGQ